MSKEIVQDSCWHRLSTGLWASFAEVYSSQESVYKATGAVRRLLRQPQNWWMGAAACNAAWRSIAFCGGLSESLGRRQLCNSFAGGTMWQVLRVGGRLLLPLALGFLGFIIASGRNACCVPPAVNTVQRSHRAQLVNYNLPGLFHGTTQAHHCDSLALWWASDVLSPQSLSNIPSKVSIDLSIFLDAISLCGVFR